VRENIALMHLDEVCLKGGNRRLFERTLARNVGAALGTECKRLELLGGRIAVALSQEVTDSLLKRLSILPGIADLAPAVSVTSEMEAIKEEAVRLVGASPAVTFRVTAKRADKRFPIASQEINRKLGALIAERTGKKVKLESPEAELFVDVCSGRTFLYINKISGVGGLPVGSSGRLVASLSGGLD